MYKHLHHIIPRHMGGTDDPDNLVELTIEEHAEEHRKLYEQYGKHEDYIAWKGLSGKMGKEELMHELAVVAGNNSAKNQREQGRWNWHNGSEEDLQQRRSKAGSVTTNKDSTWWFNGKEYKFCVEQPEGYEKSAAPNNPGKKTAGTRWWNNGTKHKRSTDCPGDGWVEGRINKGNLGGARVQSEEANLKRSATLKEYHKKVKEHG